MGVSARDLRIAPSPWWRGLSGYQWFVFAIASGAWLFDTLDQRLFSLARLAALSSLMGLPGSEVSVQSAAKFATAAFLLGWGLGGVVFGAMGDRQGRARMLTICIALYALGSAFTAFSRSATEFVVLRLATGVGIGGVFGLAVSVISDAVAGRARTAMLALLQVLSTVGNVLAALLKFGVDALAAEQRLGDWEVWRVLFLVGALPILLALAAAWGLRESPQWLQLKREGRLPGGWGGPYREILNSATMRRHLLLGTVLSIAGVVGLWAIGEFAIDLQDGVFTHHYAQSHAASQVPALVARAKNLSFMLQMAGGAMGMALFAWYAERRGRRPAFMLAFAASFVSTVLIYWRLDSPADAYWMMPIMGAAQFSVFAGFAIYLPELFSARVRATGVSFAYNFGRFAAAAGSLGSAWLASRVFGGFESPLPMRYSAMAMSVIFLIGIAAAWKAPETLGRGEQEED